MKKCLFVVPSYGLFALTIPMNVPSFCRNKGPPESPKRRNCLLDANAQIVVPGTAFNVIGSQSICGTISTSISYKRQSLKKPRVSSVKPLPMTTAYSVSKSLPQSVGNFAGCIFELNSTGLDSSNKAVRSILNYRRCSRLDVKLNLWPISAILFELGKIQ